MLTLHSVIVRFVFVALVLSLATSAHASAQTPIPQPKLPEPTLALPPGPPVADWQPHARAVIGGTIVITGQNFRPADFQAAIGTQKFRLPVRVATSTSTRIELEVPDGALGLLGTLAVGYAGTQATILETSYRIDPPAPSVIDVSTGGAITPFVKRNLVVRVREFPGVKANADNISFGGTCGFRKHAGVTYGTLDRANDLSLRISIEGWFDRSGSCQLQVNVPALTATGASVGTVQVTTPFTVAAPQRYVLDPTGTPLTDKLHTELVHFGIGNICVSSTNGVATSNSDFAVVSRGGPVDVECVFQTATWVLPPGVRLAEIGWRSTKVGNRCGLYGTFSHTFPGVSFTFARGVTVVKPDANQPASDFFVFGDNTVTEDGVTFASGLNGPRTVIKPFAIGIQCVSVLTILTTSQGTFGPTTDPQAFAFVLDRVVLEGPPGLTTADLLR
jgi:hypothetical protein